jgi:hypothetical protein
MSAEDELWPALPTETEIYLLPDGQVVIADMPVELRALLAQLGARDVAAPAEQLPAATATCLPLP